MNRPAPQRRLAAGLASVFSLLAGISLGACVNDDTTLYEVNLSGTIDVAEGEPSGGRVHVEVLHARSGAGTLAYPLRPITDLELDELGEFAESVLVPMENGEGLVVYAWLDRDGDGALCAPGAAPEPAGIIELEDFPAHELEVELVLTEPCAGPEILYP